MKIGEARVWLAERLTAPDERDDETADREPAGEDETHGLKQVFAERSITVGTMERNLRLAVVAALLVLVAAAVLIGLRDSAFGSGELSPGSLGVVMPKVVFLVTIAFLTLGWTYFLWGVLHAHLIVRFGGLVLFSWAMLELWNEDLPLWIWRMAPSYVLLACVWLVGAATLRVRARERWQQELQLLFFPLVLLLVGGLYFAFWWRLRPLHDSRYYTLLLSHQLSELSFGLIPLLYVAGVDFAEWGDTVSTRVAEVVGGIRAPYLVAAGAGGVAAFALADRASSEDARFFAVQLGFGALLAVLVGVPAVAALRSRAASRVPYAAVFAAAVVLLLLVVGVDRLVPASGPTHVTFRHPAAPRFQLEYPLSWDLRSVPGEGDLRLFVLGPYGVSPTRFLVIYIPKVDAAALPDPLGELYKPTVQSRGRDGPWSLTKFTGKGMTGIAWQRRVQGAIWLLIGVAKPGQAAGQSATFASIAHSWTMNVTPAPTEAQTRAEDTVHSERVFAIAAGAWLALAGLGAFVLLRRGRRNPGWLSAGALFFVTAGVLDFLFDLPSVAHRLGYASLSAHLRFSGIQTAAAAGTIAAILFLAVTRRVSSSAVRLLSLLLVLNGGLLAIQWIDRALTAEKDAAGRFSIVQGVLIIVAFGWDIGMSGEAITNRHTSHVPRQTRVLVYLGYVMVAATAVLFFSSLRYLSHGAVIEPDFESEGFPDAGLLTFGPALLVTLFVVRLGRSRSRPEERSADSPREAVELEAPS